MSKAGLKYLKEREVVQLKGQFLKDSDEIIAKEATALTLEVLALMSEELSRIIKLDQDECVSELIKYHTELKGILERLQERVDD